MNGDVAAAWCHGQVWMLPGYGEGGQSPVQGCTTTSSPADPLEHGHLAVGSRKGTLRELMWEQPCVASPHSLQPIAVSMRQNFYPGITGSGLYGVHVSSVLFKGVFSWFCSPTDLRAAIPAAGWLSCWSSVLLWEYLLVIPWAIPSHRWAGIASVAGLMSLFFQEAENTCIGLAIIQQASTVSSFWHCFRPKTGYVSVISARSCELNYSVF